MLGKTCHQETPPMYCIMKIIKRKRMNKFKYGIKVPENGNTLWRDAIAKETKNVIIRFEIRNAGEKPPGGYGELNISPRDCLIKIDIAMKARLVAGNHNESEGASCIKHLVCTRSPQYETRTMQS
jgi:hypothetical protein